MKPKRSAKLSKSAPVEQSRGRAVIGVCLLLAVVVVAVFGRTVRHGFVNLDDDLYVYQNPLVVKGLSLHGVGYVFNHQMCDFYHPLTMLSLMLDRQIYGLNAGGYHLTNLLLHAATTIGLFLVLRRMMSFRVGEKPATVKTPGDALWPCAFVAALFAIHPLRVESVAWITERKDVLSGLFFVLTLGAYVRFARGPFSPGRYLAVVVFFTLGLLSKPSLVTLPFLLLLLDYWPLARMQSDNGRPPFKVLLPLVIEKIPLFGLSIALCAVTFVTQQQYMASVNELPFSSRLGYALVSYVFYLGKTIYPHDLVVLYPFSQSGPPWLQVMLAAALLAAISTSVVALRERHPYLVTGWFWYLGMLVPMIGLIHTGIAARADRFTYLAQIGVNIMLVWAATNLAASWRNGRRMIVVGAASVIAVLMICAWKQTSYWRDSESLWTHALACLPLDNSLIENDLGQALLEKGDLKDAIARFERALQIHPGYAEAHNNLGVALLQENNLDDATTQFQAALQSRPDYATAHFNLGKAIFQKGDVDGAAAHFQQALKLNADYAEAHNGLGNALLQKGRVDEAIRHFQAALQINPDYVEARYDFGNAMFQKGDVDGAIVHYQEALQRKPDYARAHNNLGVALLQKGRVDEAIAHDQKALELNPDFAEAHNNLANALVQKENVADAISHYQRALQLKPDFVEALNNLAWFLATTPQDSLRDGSQALGLARRANQLTDNSNPAVLATLAAACAEAGRFPEAVAAAQRALHLATSQNNPALVAALESQLKVYQAGSPFHTAGVYH